MLAPNKVASPLSRKATLVAVTVSQWTARKLDKKVTKEINRRHAATDDAGRYNKLLIQAERLAEITTLVTKARTLHYALTRPWADEGPRILPNALYQKFANEFRDLKRRFDDAADRFCADYPRFVEERKVELNGMFNKDDYPPADEIRSKFRLEMKVLPFPDVTDFRADLDDDTLADIKREIEASSSGEAAFKHTARQVVEVVGHMAEKLRDYNANFTKKGEKKKRGPRNFFTDSLVENVRELAGLLPAFNLTDDPTLTEITARIERELCVEEGDKLRKNPKARETVQKSAEEIVETMKNFLA